MSTFKRQIKSNRTRKKYRKIRGGNGKKNKKTLEKQKQKKNKKKIQVQPKYDKKKYDSEYSLLDDTKESRKFSNRDSYEDDIKDDFLNIDIDRNGYIDFKELKKGLQKLGINISLNKSRELIKLYDDNPDGKIELREFSQLKKDIDSRSLRQPIGLFNK